MAKFGKSAKPARNYRLLTTHLKPKNKSQENNYDLQLTSFEDLYKQEKEAHDKLKIKFTKLKEELEIEQRLKTESYTKARALRENLENIKEDNALLKKKVKELQQELDRYKKKR